MTQEQEAPDVERIGTCLDCLFHELQTFDRAELREDLHLADGKIFQLLSLRQTGFELGDISGIMTYRDTYNHVRRIHYYLS